MTRNSSFRKYSERLLDFIVRHSVDSSSDEGAAEFEELALALFRTQFEHVPSYRQFCEARKATPETVKTWPEIPAIPTSAFKEFELSSLPAEERTAVFYSSGTTTQKRSRHYQNIESLKLYEASLLPWFRAHVLPDFGNEAIDNSKCRLSTGSVTLVILTPPPALAPHSSLVYMFETVRRAFGSSDSVFTGKLDSDEAWTLDMQKTLSALHKSINDAQPVVLLGTAFSFVHLLDYLRERQIRFLLPADSCVLETGGYKGRSRVIPKPELHTTITKRLGIPPTHIVCEYGMSELSSQAYDRVAGPGELEIANFQSQISDRLFRFPPWTRVQLISPETGEEASQAEIGLIRIFDLANVYSALAIQTEDLGVRRGEGFELIGRAAMAEPRGCSLTARG
jgi:hypothetical protein